MEVMAIIIRPFTYDSETNLVSGRKNQIQIENLSPVLSDEERIEQRRCIEEGLFDIFVKYTENEGKMNSYCRAAAV